MNQLRPRGHELLEQARLERTPDAATRARVFEALMATEAVMAAVEAAANPKASRPLVGLGKWLLLAALVGVLASALYLAGHVGAKPEPPANLPDRPSR